VEESILAINTIDARSAGSYQILIVQRQ
jgi:hypothetical protein